MKVQSRRSHMKEPESHLHESTYRQHLARDVNTSAKPGRDTDIGLLVACKVQLSSEVIRCKTESLRLQKDKEAALHRIGELDTTVARLTEKTRNLEERLRAAESENRRLKSRSLALDEENASLLQKLSLSPNKYHSFPFSEDKSSESPKHSVVSKERLQTNLTKKVPDVQDWREISQKMLQQMKEEMRELEQFSTRFCTLEVKEGEEITLSDKNKDGQELESGLSALRSDTDSLKQLLLSQKEKMAALHTFLQQGKLNTSTSPSQSTSNVKSALFPTVEPLALERQGDNYNLEKISQDILQALSRSDEMLTQSPERLPPPKNERVCPICQETFDSDVPQRDFEEHVFVHLEEESASLLDQYEIL